MSLAVVDLTSTGGPSDPRTAALGPDADRYDLDGVPLFHLPLPGATTIVALAFGTGRADEPIHRTGLTHLAEHLVMGGIGDLALDGNGHTEAFRVVFSLAGSPDDASAFLRRIGDAIRSPRFDRIEAEVSVLQTEADGRGPLGGIPGRLAWLRFGHAGIGGWGLPELFLRRPDRDALEAWIGRHLVAGNAALWVAGILPGDLAVDLPAGATNERAAVDPIAGLWTPTLAIEDIPGVGAGFVVERTAAVATALRIAERRLRRSLRVDRSLGYEVGVEYLPIDAATAHVTLIATCQPETTAEVEGLLLATLDDLVNRGPEASELALDVARLRRASAEPMAVPGRLDAEVRDHLFGRERESVAQLVAEHESVTPEAARFALGRAMGTLMLCVPRSGFVPNRTLHDYPGPSTISIGGPRAYTAVQAGKRWPWRAAPPTRRLLVGPGGVAVHDQADRRIACVPWRDCVAYVHEPDGRRLVGRDGYLLAISTADWERGPEAVGVADLYAPPEVTVPAPR